MDIYLPVAELSMNLLLLLSIGLAVGVLSGMFGIGGGFIMTPLLIFLGVPPAIAVGTGASQVVASSVASALGHWRRDNVDLKMGVLLIAGGLVGAVSGVFVQTILQRLGQLDLVISLTYVVVLGVIGTLMLSESIQTFRRSRGGTKAASRKAGQHTWVQGLPLKQRFHKSKLYASAIPPVIIGLLVGWLTAMGLKPDHVAWVPSNGAAPAVQDLAAGGIDIVTCSVPEARAMIDAGKVRSLAVMASERNAAFASVPTLKEAIGVDYSVGAWRGIAAPKGLPKDIAEKLVSELKKANESKEFREFMGNRGFGVKWGDAAQFASFMAEGDTKMKAAMTAAGLAKKA